MNPSHIVIFNRSANLATGGWIHIVPKGELPNREAGIVQVLDDQSLDAILAAIDADKQRLGANWPGIYAGREHFIYNDDKDSAALAWFKDFEKRDTGIWAKEDGLTPLGQSAIANREYKFTSFVADRADLKKIEGNRYRIMRLDTVGFTNQANGKELLTPITNRATQKMPASGDCPKCRVTLKDSGMAGIRACPNCGDTFADSFESAANQTKPNQVKNMKNVALKLGLAAEASEDAILGEVTKIINRSTALETSVTELRGRIAPLETENQTLLGEQVDAILAQHGVKDAKLINRLKLVLLPLKNRQERIDALADFGIKPVAAAPAQRTLNRGGGSVPAEKGADEQADNQKAGKIMNRAKDLVKETPNLSLATAVGMATAELA